MDNKNCAFYYEVSLLQILLREGQSKMSVQKPSLANIQESMR